LTPNIQVNLTKENSKGTLRAGVLMKKIALNESMKMDNIYYDLGKATLPPIAYKGLNSLAKLMHENPQIVVELSAHTDCRGSTEDNLDLSQRRANSVVNYIKSKVKLKKNQIKAKGYGESRPLNSCIDGVQCSEEEHQENRRTELTVIDILVEDPKIKRSLSSMMQERNFGLK
jgi:outer membrane protein OmpA-like peptidoglycan-associated protein